MSSKKLNRKRLIKTESFDDFEEIEPSKKKNLSNDEISNLTNLLIRLFIFNEAKKTPVKRSDINNLILKNYKGNRKLLKQVLNFARLKLNTLFGWEIVELPTFDEKGNLEFDSFSGIYIIRKTPKLVEFMTPILKHLEIPHNFGLLMTIICAIYINKGSIVQESFFDVIQKYGILKIDHNYGNIEDQLTDFVSKAYLSLKKYEHDNGFSYEYRIGARSFLEIGKLKIVNFINSICGTKVDENEIKDLKEEHNRFFEDVDTIQN